MAASAQAGECHEIRGVVIALFIISLRRMFALCLSVSVGTTAFHVNRWGFRNDKSERVSQIAEQTTSDDRRPSSSSFLSIDANRNELSVLGTSNFSTSH